MTKFLFTSSDGLISYTAIAGTLDTYIDNNVYGNCIARKIDTEELDSIILSTWHWAGTAFETHLPNTNPHFVWDTTTLSYIEPIGYIDTVKLAKIKEVNSSRETKTNSPITYLALTWDADTTSRENINGKIVEISSKQLLGITDLNLFWKDTSNVIHTWSSMGDYLLWLRGLAIAIAERTTDLYATAWTKKAEVEALTTVSDVVTYDINTGW